MLSNDTIFWQFDFNRYIYRPTKAFVTIYHVADPYMHAWSDLTLARRARLVVCTSPKYVEYYAKHITQRKVTYVPHGISDDEFVLSGQEIERIKKTYGYFFLLVGSLNDDVDYHLMEQIASKVKLLVLGPEKINQPINQEKWDKLKSNNNIEYLGIIPAAELKHYIYCSECCLLLYKFTLKKALGSGSPLKVMNYFAQFKPVITSIDPETPKLEGRAIYWAKGEGDYLKLLDQSKSNLLKVDTEAIKAYLDEHKYPILINRILAKIDG